MSYLNDFLGQSVVEPAELLPVGDEQLEHVAGRLSHCFVLKLDKQTGGGETRQERINDAQEISFFFFYVDQLCEERSDVKPAFSSRRKKTQHKTAA